MTSHDAGHINVVPMRDELALGHEGRRRTLVGARLLDEHMAWLGAALSAISGVTADAPQLEILARSSGVSAVLYARDHSFLGMFVMAAPNDQCHPYGSADMTELTRQYGMRVPRKGAYICQACVDQDLKNESFSWFHRKHHLVGVDWCMEHKVGLHQVLSDTHFVHPPHIWRDSGQISESHIGQQHWPENSYIQRYVELSVAVLGRGRPLLCDALNKVILDQANALNVSQYKSKTKTLLSDRILEMAGDDWLFMHFPQLAIKAKGNSISELDNILRRRDTAAPGQSYMLALAALFDSAEQAKDAIDMNTGNDAVDTMTPH